jgi:hypothetical protein
MDFEGEKKKRQYFAFACVTHGDAISPFFVEKITKIFGKKEEEPNSSYQIN